MGLAYEVKAGAVTNTGAGTLTALTFSTGDNGNVRNFNNPAMARMEFLSRKGATAGAVRVRSPLLHDNVQGIRFQCDAASRGLLLGREIGQRVYAQDALVVEADSGGADSTAVAFGVYYDDLPGAAARLHSWGDIVGLIEHIKPVEVDTTNAALGVWGTNAITTTQDLLEANSDYAVLGYATDVAVAAIAISGTDTANLKVGGPGQLDDFATTDYFVRVSELTGRPHIPVFNSANKGVTNVHYVSNAANANPKVTLVCALLSQNLTN